MATSSFVLRSVSVFRLLWIAVIAAVTVPALADQFPTRPIRMIVPTAPGGGTDILARAVGDAMSKSLGQQIVVDNRPGAGSTIGTTIASKAAPDGYTILIVTPSFAINPGLRAHLPYDSLKDFSPITEIASVQNLLLVQPSLPVKDVQGLVSLIRTHPGKYNYASGGYGTPPHMAMELFKAMGGFDIVHVAYKGSGPALLGLITNQVSLMINGAPPALPLIEQGKVRPLAVTGPTRWEQMPSLPTISETVLPGYEALTWFGLLAPKGTPHVLIAKLQKAVSASLKQPSLSKSLPKQGYQAVGSSPEEYAALIRKEMKKYKQVIEKEHLKLL